jgi:hypothetical protein
MELKLYKLINYIIKMRFLFISFKLLFITIEDNYYFLL